MQRAFAEQVCSLPALPTSHLFSYTYSIYAYNKALYTVKYLLRALGCICAMLKLQNSDNYCIFSQDKPEFKLSAQFLQLRGGCHYLMGAVQHEWFMADPCLSSWDTLGTHLCKLTTRKTPLMRKIHMRTLWRREVLLQNTRVCPKTSYYWHAAVWAPGCLIKMMI